MANTYPVKISFQAVDKVTAQVREISAKIRGITKPLRDQQDAFADLGRSMNLDRIGAGISNIRSGVSDLIGSLARVGFVAVGAFGGLYATVSSFVNTADEIDTVAGRLGISTRSLQELRYAAQLSDIEIEQLQLGLKFLNKNMVEAAKGSGDAANVFKALGISTTFADGRMKTIDDILPQLADKFQTIRSGALKTSLAMAIFGKSGDKMASLLSKGSAGIAALREEASKSGGIINESDIEAATKFDDLMKQFKAAALGLRNTFGAALLPAFTGFFEALRTFFLENRQLFADFGKALGDGLQALLPTLLSGLKALSEYMKEFSALTPDEKANKIANAFKFLVALALLPTIAALGSLIMSIGQLGYALTVLFANPIGLAIGGIALLAFGIYQLIQHSDKVQEFMSRFGILGQAIFDALMAPINVVKALGSALQWLFDKFGGKTLDVGANVAGMDAGADQTMRQLLQNQTMKNESSISVNFSNMPKGTQVATQNSSGMNMDLALGYSMAGF